jgi:hypothetical protein
VSRKALAFAAGAVTYVLIGFSIVFFLTIKHSDLGVPLCGRRIAMRQSYSLSAADTRPICNTNLDQASRAASAAPAA